MHTTRYEFDTGMWAYKNFGKVQLFDKRRTRRLVDMATKLAMHPGQFFSSLYTKWYDIKAPYNLLDQNVMTPDTIQSNHRALATQNMLNWHGDILLIEDSSEFEWNGQELIEGLGPVGSGRKGDQGFILHSTIALGIRNKTSSKDPCVKILGLPSQQYYVRPPKERRPINEETDNKGSRQICGQRCLKTRLQRVIKID